MISRETKLPPDAPAVSRQTRWAEDHYPDYLRDVDESIKFSGLDVDFFTAGKARWICRELLALRSGSSRLRALDIGCGIGTIHSYLIDAVDELVGVDVSTDALSVARERNPRAKYAHYDGQRLPFSDGQFDVALTVCVLHHVAPSSWQSFLGEADRVLRPGGAMLVFEHNPWNPLTRIAVNRCTFDHDAVLLTARRVRELMTEIGFKEMRSRFIFFTPFRHAGAQWLDERLGFLPLGAQYYTFGVKP